MDATPLLTTVTQVAVTLATLSGVAGVLGPRSGSALDEATRVLLRDVAGVGLGVALFSFLPLVFVQATSDDELTWRIFSGIAATYWITTAVLAARTMRSLRLMEQGTSKLVLLAPASTLVGVTLYAWNVLAPSSMSVSRYLGALTCHVAVAGILFVVAVFGRRGQ